jgi:hypothetical protein
MTMRNTEHYGRNASIDMLFSALMFLLSRYAMKPQDHLRDHIRDHLNWVAQHPDAERHPTLLKTCQRLALHWSTEAGGELRPEPDRLASETLH